MICSCTKKNKKPEDDLTRINVKAINKHPLIDTETLWDISEVKCTGRKTGGFIKLLLSII